jgi:hypothetical protein
VAAADDDHIEHRAHAISIPEHRIGVYATSLGCSLLLNLSFGATKGFASAKPGANSFDALI